MKLPVHAGPHHVLADLIEEVCQDLHASPKSTCHANAPLCLMMAMSLLRVAHENGRCLEVCYEIPCAHTVAHHVLADLIEEVCQDLHASPKSTCHANAPLCLMMAMSLLRVAHENGRCLEVCYEIPCAHTVAHHVLADAVEEICPTCMH